MNMLSVDENTVIIDAAQTQLIKDIEHCGITVIPLTLRHSRTLGGSFHCVTLDLLRE
jgi:N-dimethylarginine dimethylaminohydrolase